MGIKHYENFPVASLLIPENYRPAILAIYRFARSADDFADEGRATAEARLIALASYAGELDAIENGYQPDPVLAPIFGPLAEAISRYNLPIQLCRDLLSAFSQDVVKKRYADFDELQNYCSRSANPVGRLLIHVWERVTPDNLEFSDSICTGLQLINFWQDIAIDWKIGRVYLPQDEMKRFAVSEADIANGQTSAAWRALMEFQVERAAKLLRHGASLVHQLPGRLGWEIRLTIQGGLRIAERITAVQGDVFSRRPTLGIFDWPRLVKRSMGMKRPA